MTRKLLLKFALFTVICLAGLSWGTQAKASALWCAVLAPAYNANDCAVPGGQNYSTHTVITNINERNSDILKSEFIINIQNFEKNGQYFQKVGAKYIEELISKNSLGKTWQQRVNDTDVTLSIDYVDYTQNTGYNPLTNKDEPYDNVGRQIQSLRFAVKGVLGYPLMIKLDCGNPVGELGGLPSQIPPPIITGSKVDTNGNPNNGPYASDKISATTIVPGTPSSDTRNSYSLQVQEGPASVTAANNITGWNLVGYDAFTCVNTATSPPTDCGKPKNQYIPINVPHGTSYTYTLNTAVKNGYIYTVNWVYQPPPLPNPVTVKGDKVDTNGNYSADIASDPIRATGSDGVTLSDTTTINQFKITNLPSGSTSVTPDAVPGWTVVGYTVCNALSTSSACTRPTPLKPIPGQTYNVNAVGGQTYNMYWVFSKNCVGPGCGPIVSFNSCPSIPNSNVIVSLPDQSLSSPPPPTATTSPNSWYYQYTPLNSTNVTSIQDISSGGNRILSILNLKSQSYQQAVVDYSPFISGYPYDNNQASVTYTSSYTATPYLSTSTPSSYTCADGSTPNLSHVCTKMTTTGGLHTTTGTASTPIYCTQGGSWNGSNCGTYKVSTITGYTYTCPFYGASLSGSGSTSVCVYSTSYPAQDRWTCSNSSATWNNGKTCLSKNRIHHYVCPYGGTPISTTCYAYYSYTPTASPVYSLVSYSYPSPALGPVTYTCPSPYTGGGSTSYCSYNDTKTVPSYSPATAWYNYVRQTSTTVLRPSTVNALAMTECYDRGFKVTTVNANNANISLNNNYENPTVAAAGGYTASVQFFYNPNVTPTQGLRQPMKANLTYTYTFSKDSSVLCVGNNIPFTVTGGYGPSGPSPYPITAGASCGVSVPPLMPGDTVCAVYSVSPTGSMANNVGNIVNGNGGNVSSGPQCSGHVVNEPYFKVFGGDVSAGSTFATTSSSGAPSCVSNTANASAGVYGWNTAGGAGGIYTQTYAGSGAQFAVTSPAGIQGVASNQNNINASSGSSPNPLGLSFSNTTNNSASVGQFGGNLTAANCITDFYASLQTLVPAAAPIGSPQSLDGLDGKYIMTSSPTITGGNITSGKHVTIYATGNIFISGDIKFPGSYGAVDQIPSLILIVKGNIYISNNVKNLSGIYIAQPTANSSADGYIYDCASGPSNAMSNYLIYDQCGNQLTVNGSFIANKVALMRTGISSPNGAINSSLRRSSSNETNINTNAAEVFNYGPAFWMNLTLPQATSTGTSSAGYDSIISLPPIL